MHTHKNRATAINGVSNRRLLLSSDNTAVLRRTTGTLSLAPIQVKLLRPATSLVGEAQPCNHGRSSSIAHPVQAASIVLPRPGPIRL